MKFYYLTLFIIILNIALQVPSWFGFFEYKQEGDRPLINQTLTNYQNMKEPSFLNLLKTLIDITIEAAKLSILAPYSLYNILVQIFPSNYVTVFILPLGVVFYLGLFQMVSNRFLE